MGPTKVAQDERDEWTTSSSALADLAPPLEQVGNQDPRGVHDQPDWTAAAQALKARVLPALAQAGLPSDKSQACREMLAQARDFYRAIEEDARLKNAINHRWRAVFRAEFAGCMDGLSLTAVHCVTLSLKARNAEYAWLVDQCARAFPKAG